MQPVAGLPSSLPAPASLPGHDTLVDERSPLPAAEETAVAKPPPVPPAPPSPSPSAPHSPTVSLKAVPREPASPPTSRARIPIPESVWPREQPPRREWPRKAKIAIAGVAALLGVLVVVSRRGRGGELDAQATPLPAGSAMVSAEDLHNRREVRADEFRPKHRFLTTAPRDNPAPSAPALLEPRDAPIDLASRRAERERNPEEVAALRHHVVSPTAPATEGSPPPASPGPRRRERNLFVDEAALPTAAADSAASPRPSLHLPAGTQIRATLSTPLGLDGGTSPVVVEASANGPLPTGAKFLGTASLSGDRVILRFRSLALPDGREARVFAEAQDVDGAFGIAVHLSHSDSEPSVTATVTSNVATDVVLDALGAGVASRAAQGYVRETDRRQLRHDRPSASLATGTEITVFLSQTLDVESETDRPHAGRR